MFRILSLALVLSVALLGSTHAKDKKEKVVKKTKVKEHVKVGKKTHDKIAKVKFKEKIKVHSHGKHVAEAVVEKGKIKSVAVKHGDKDVKVAKFKSKVKLHVAAPSPDGYHYVSLADDVASVGFGYNDEDDDNKLVVIWFPPELVDGGAEGADDVPE